MRLDRNISGDGRGKYGLIKNRELAALARRKHGALPDDVVHALNVLEDHALLDWGTTPETEFFVMRLKDESAAGGLRGYAAAAWHLDEEYAREILRLADRAGPYHPNCKRPD